MRCLISLLAFLVIEAAAAETVVYELYRLSKDGRELIAQGVREYRVSDIEVSESWIGPRSWQKQLALNDRFAIGGSVHRPQKLAGFGLWLHQRPRWYELWRSEGFSWDWFNREDGAIYRKLQGPGRVKATIVKGPDYEELTAVEFLDDVTLRLDANPWFLFTEGHTHHVVLRKGSVLRLAP